jgi:hypothetical protein
MASKITNWVETPIGFTSKTARKKVIPSNIPLLRQLSSMKPYPFNFECILRRLGGGSSKMHLIPVGKSLQNFYI